MDKNKEESYLINTKMVDRKSETKKLKDLVENNSDSIKIVINGDSGAGKSFFVNQYIFNTDNTKNIRIDFAKNYNCESKFIELLINSLYDIKKSIFIDFFKCCENDYLLVYPQICENNSDEEIISIVKEHYYKNDKLIYKSMQEKTKKLFHKAKQDRNKKYTIKLLEYSVKTVLSMFINSIQEDTIVFDNIDDIFVDETIQFVNSLNKKIIFVITSILPKNYGQRSIEIKNFKTEDFQYFQEMLETYFPLIKYSNLEEMAKTLNFILHGSPKELALLVGKVKNEIDNCSNDEQVKQIIYSEIDKQSNIINDDSNIIILYLLFFHEEKISKDEFEKLFFSDECNSFLFNKTLNNFRQFKLIDESNGIQCSNITKFTLNSKLYSNSFDIALLYKCIAVITKALNKFENNTILLQILSNIIINMRHINYEENAYNFHILKYAELLFENGKNKKSAKYYSAVISNISEYYKDNKELLLKIINLLYNEGYYKDIYAHLSNINVDDWNINNQFEYYFCLANCSALVDNIKSIDFYDKAIRLNNKDSLKAITCKLLVQLECCSNTYEFNLVYKEYNDVVAKYKEQNNDKNYIALLRNALDFQDINTSLNTMKLALKLAEENSFYDELCKIKQNMSINLIRIGQLEEAEKLLNDVFEYCKNNLEKELSYPLINLSNISIYNYFINGNKKCILKSVEYSTMALDYASSYYAETLSELQYLTALSLVYKEQIGNVSKTRIKELRNIWYEKTLENNRKDNRIVQKTLLCLIASSRITNDIEEAQKYLITLYNSNKELVVKVSSKINKLIKELDLINLLPLLEETPCSEYKKEIRFEPWLISLTHY